MRRVFLLGYVVSTEDPDGLGRIQVELRGFPTKIKSPWLRQVVPYAGGKNAKTGWVILPENGDEVVLLSPNAGDDLSADDLSSMLVLGCVYSGVKKPVYSNKDGKNIKQQIVFPGGHSVQFDHKAETIKIVSKKDDTHVLLDNKTPAIKIMTKDATVVIGGKDKITIEAKGAITVKTKAALTFDAKGDVKINAGGAVKITAKGNVDVGGAQVKIQGKSKVTIKGSAGVAIN